MGLRINTNVSVVNTARTLHINTGSLNRSLKRLSSGLCIDYAAEDAVKRAIAAGFNNQARGNHVGLGKRRPRCGHHPKPHPLHQKPDSCQCGTGMLTQANFAPQTALQLIG